MRISSPRQADSTAWNSGTVQDGPHPVGNEFVDQIGQILLRRIVSLALIPPGDMRQ